MRPAAERMKHIAAGLYFFWRVSSQLRSDDTSLI